MPNYCDNAGVLTAHNLRTKKLFLEILDWASADNKEDDRNFCDFFIPRPDWKSIIEMPEGYYIQSGAWKEEKVWLAKEGEPNIPLTDEQKEIIKEKCRGNIGDYDFCCNVWGTKWGLFDEHIEGDENKLYFGGTTAWGPFATMFENVVALQEELPEEEKLLFSMEYDYSESGCDFSGRQQIEVYDDGTMEIYDEEMGYEEGVWTWDGEHGTLPEPEEFWENKKDWSGCLAEGDNFSELKDGDLLMENGLIAILMPSQKEAYINGFPHELEVHPMNGEEWFIHEQ